MKWDRDAVDELRTLWSVHRGKIGQIAKVMGRTRGSISGKSRVMGLQFLHNSDNKPLAPGHPAVTEARTVFRKRVIPADLNVLKSGDNQRKLGQVVTKGRWKGFPIYSLTLEERATCPTSCRQWASCYGNNMQWATRYQHGPDLERAIVRELTFLQRRHRGFVVRLHVLGDFYSIPYVHFWGEALEYFPALHIFGYTHHQRGHRMGDAISEVRRNFPARFMVRHSDAYKGYRTAVIQGTEDAGDRIICPAQTGRTTNCGTCALCWGTKRPIAFLAH